MQTQFPQRRSTRGGGRGIAARDMALQEARKRDPMSPKSTWIGHFEYLRSRVSDADTCTRHEHACNCEQHGRCFLDTHAGSGTSCDYTIKIKMLRAYNRPSTVQRMHTTALTTSCPSWGASYDSVVFLSRTLTERHSRNPSPRWPFCMIA